MHEGDASTAVTSVGDRRPAAAANGDREAGRERADDRTPAPGRPARDDAAPTPQRAPLTRGQTRWLIAILAMAAVVRVAWLAYANVEPPEWYIPSGDSFGYWYYGNEIANGNGYVSYLTHEATAYYPIGFPAILAAVYWLGNHTPLVDPDLMLLTGVFQVVISVATVWLTFVVGRRLVGTRAGLVAAALMAFFPNLVYQITTIQVETTFIFLTLAALAIVVDHDWSTGPPGRNRLLAFGAVLALSALTRPFSAPLLIGLALAVLAVGAGWRRALLVTSVPMLVLVATFTPWTIRNAVRLGGFIPSSTNMGDTLCIDRNDDAQGGFRWSTHDGCADPDLGEAERSRESTRMAVEWVVDNPGREVLQIGRRARLMFGDDHDAIVATEGLGSGPIFSDTSREVWSSSGDWYFRVVLAASIVGLPLLVGRSPRPERRLALSAVVALLVIPLLLWGNPRFHLPLVPFMAISAGALAASAAGRLRGHTA
ncbi:MAG TPA: glycosyltransferase family 39 protein [Acidimicrobiales bacterium]